MGRSDLEQAKIYGAKHELEGVDFIDRFGKVTEPGKPFVHAILKFSNEEEVRVTAGEFRALAKFPFKLPEEENGSQAV